MSCSFFDRPVRLDSSGDAAGKATNASVAPADAIIIEDRGPPPGCRMGARTTDEESGTTTTNKELPVDVQPKPPTTKGPAEWFTGDVWIDSIVRGAEPSRVRVSAVHFTPGARTAWHSHAVGQTLYVTEGKGMIRSRGGEVIEIRSGDIVSTPADEWHWHGAAPDHFMAHLSITEATPGDERPEADWGEHVTDKEYRDH